MQSADAFYFDEVVLDTATSTVICSYSVHVAHGDVIRLNHTVRFETVSSAQWASVPQSLLEQMLRDVQLSCGVMYWKLHAAPIIRLNGFELTRAQAEFWNTCYTKGLAEFFFRSNIDFRSLVQFPFSDHTEGRPVPFMRRDAALLAIGGGKDSIVAAEMLRSMRVPFHTFVLGRTALQSQVAREIGVPLVQVSWHADRARRRIAKANAVQSGYPSVLIDMFVGVLVAALGNYRYVVFANEESAEHPNAEYRGLHVNHQWSKSREAELLVRRYLRENVTSDIVPFSLVPMYTEIEMVRKFTAYPKYFPVFSSCNGNFFPRGDPAFFSRGNAAYWCGRCIKCVFVYSCLTAFVSKEIAVQIVGKNLHAERDLEPLYRSLLGLAKTPTFECVGTPDEMRLALHLSRARGVFDGDMAIRLYESEALLTQEKVRELSETLLQPVGADTVPAAFRVKRDRTWEGVKIAFRRMVRALSQR